MPAVVQPVASALFISGTLVTLTVKALAKFDVPSLTFTYIL